MSKIEGEPAGSSIRAGHYLAQGIKDVVEVDENLPLCDLGNVVHALTGVVPDTGILIGEAGEDGRDYLP